MGDCHVLYILNDISNYHIGLMIIGWLQVKPGQQLSFHIEFKYLEDLSYLVTIVRYQTISNYHRGYLWALRNTILSHMLHKVIKDLSYLVTIAWYQTRSNYHRGWIWSLRNTKLPHRLHKVTKEQVLWYAISNDNVYPGWNEGFTIISIINVIYMSACNIVC